MRSAVGGTKVVITTKESIHQSSCKILMDKEYGVTKEAWMCHQN